MSAILERVNGTHDYVLSPWSYASDRGHSAYSVSLRDATSTRYWCRHFDTTPERLAEAVRQVGSNPAIVQLLFRTR